MKTTASLLTLALALPAVLAAGSHGGHRRHHAEVAKRNEHTGLQKRFEGARWSFYDVGLGACGKVNVATDFIVALNAEQFGTGYPGRHCGEVISMTFNGKTTQATITDRCPGCPFGGLDLSRGLFGFFAAESTGIIHGSWSFGGGAPAPAPPVSTLKWTAPVTLEWKPDPTTWKPVPTPTWTPQVAVVESSSASSSAASSSASVSSSVAISSSVSSSADVVPTPSAAAAAADPKNVENLNKIVVSMGRIAVTGCKQRPAAQNPTAADSTTPAPPSGK